jgi:hypothetical protein
MRKVYVQVNADFSPEGVVTPLSFVWEDGRQFDIDHVLDIKRAASLKVGGLGLRYSIRVMGKDSYMWLEDENKWFVEGK